MKFKNIVIYIAIALAGMCLGIVVAHMGSREQADFPGSNLQIDQMQKTEKDPGRSENFVSPAGSDTRTGSPGQPGTGNYPSNMNPEGGDGTGTEKVSDQPTVNSDSVQDAVISQPDFTFGKIKPEVSEDLSQDQAFFLNQMLTLQSFMWEGGKIYNFEQIVGRKWTGTAMFSPPSLSVVTPGVFDYIREAIEEGIPESKFGRLKELYEGALDYIRKMQSGLSFHARLTGNISVTDEEIETVYNEYKENLLRIDYIFDPMPPSLKDPIRLLLIREKAIRYYLTVFNRLYETGDVELHPFPAEWDEEVFFDARESPKPASPLVFAIKEWEYLASDLSGNPPPILSIISSVPVLSKAIRRIGKQMKLGSVQTLITFMEQFKKPDHLEAAMKALFFGLAVVEGTGETGDIVFSKSYKLDILLRLFKRFSDQTVTPVNEYLVKFPVVSWIPFDEIMGFSFFEHDGIYPMTQSPKVILTQDVRLRFLADSLSQADLGFNRLSRGFFSQITYPGENGMPLPSLDRDPIASVIDSSFERLSLPSLEIAPPISFDYLSYTRKFYKQHTDFFNTGKMVKVRIIFSRDKTAIEAARNALLGGEYFEVVAARYSDIWQPRQTIRYYPMEYFDEIITKELKNMNALETSEIVPLAIPKGYVIIKLLETIPQKAIDEKSVYVQGIPMGYLMKMWADDFPEVKLLFDGVKEHADLLEKLSQKL